ncbi:MAG: hypothetical protein HY895_12555 [Deltaproteobacteria bacterium]|nr:hypothetical protein [Deltaproteobacteria bacterium]
MPTKVDHRTKLERIKLIDILLEDASEIVADMKLGKNKQDDKQEIELLSLLFQILSLVISIRAEYYLENFAGISSNLPIKKVFTEMGADIIHLDRRKFEGERRNLRTFIADDRRSGFSNRRKKKTV